MNKVNIFLIRETILRKAQHRIFNQLTNVVYRSPLQSTTNSHLEYMKDQAYLELFTYTNFCEYMADPNFKIGGFNLRQIQSSNFLAYSSISALTQNKTEPKQSIERKLMDIIKKLGKNDKTESTYAEAKEAIMMMTIEETRNNKNLLVFLYKFVISQTEWPEPEFEDLGIQLSKIIESKMISCSYSSEEKKKIQNELDQICKRIKNKQELEAQLEKVRRNC